MMYTNLKRISVESAIFDNIINSYPARIEKVADLSVALKTFRDRKSTIFVVKSDDVAMQIVCQAKKLINLTDLGNVAPWEFIIIDRAVETSQITNLKNFERDMTGPQAWAIIIKILTKYMSCKKIVDRLNSYTDIYDPDLKQYHYMAKVKSAKQEYSLVKFENCYKYDINGAHTAALIEMFPEAKSGLLKYAARKYDMTLSDQDRRNVKQAFNLCVGMFKSKGYDGAYWHIVHRTTNILLDAIEYTDGELIYANTDGFIVQNPKQLIENQPGVYGAFKLENQPGSDIYIYQANGSLIEYTDIKGGKKQVGTIPLEIRKHFDLAAGKIVLYKKEKVDQWNNGVLTYKTTIIEEKTLC